MSTFTLNNSFYNRNKDSTLCYYLVFLANFASEIALLSKENAIETCQILSNGTLPYKRSHVATLSAEDFALGLRQSLSLWNHAPILAWFGATLDYERREYLSDVTGEVIQIDDEKEFNATFSLNMFVGGLSMGLKFAQREVQKENNVLGRCHSNSFIMYHNL